MKTILLIDDCEDMRVAFCTALRTGGYRVIEADSGIAGLKMARQHLPDLILSDIHMPGGDGSTLLRDIQTDDAVQRGEKFVRQLRRHTRAKLGQHLVFHTPTNGGATEPCLDAAKQGLEVNRLNQKIVSPFLHALTRRHQIRSPGHEHTASALLETIRAALDESRPERDNTRFAALYFFHLGTSRKIYFFRE